MENSCSFDFSAPQYIASLSDAATLAEQDGADKFFDTETFPKYSMESPKNKSNEVMETFHTPLERNIIKNERKESESVLSGQDNEVPHKIYADGNKENQPSSRNIEARQIIKAKRRSSKTSNTDEKNIARQEKCKFDGLILPINSGKEKEHTMLTRQDKVIKTPTMELRTRQIIREAKKRKASPKPEDACFSKKYASKFMSLAEKIMHFHEDTPPRFKTRFISLEEKENKNTYTHLKPTIPQSPKLITKSRIRPVENIDQQKYVFKASKLNMKIFAKPDNNDHIKLKSPTKPKPLVLSEVRKKELSNEVFQFQGKSKSKQYDSCNSLNSSITSNYSNSNRRRMPLRFVKEKKFLDEDDAYSGMACLTKTNRSTQLQPFSFDERDKEILKRKEEKIKKLQEEMSKVPVFHAAPAPSFVSSSSCNSTIKSAVSSISLLSDVSSVKGGVRFDSEMSNCDTTFKAKFPAVLYKEPFVPQKPERPFLEPNHIELNTEKRALKRQEFEKELKLKEERLEQERKEVMTLIEQIEKKKLTELRKKLVHKAQPVPQYPSV